LTPGGVGTAVAAMHDPEKIEAVLRYHERTKHHFNRYASGPGELDWANQPNPFRRYEGAPLVRLPLLGAADAPPVAKPLGLTGWKCTRCRLRGLRKPRRW